MKKATTHKASLKQTTQQSFASRMQLAASMLINQKDKLAVIAKQLGYTSAFSFSRAFKNHHGQSPSQYRRSYKHTLSFDQQIRWLSKRELSRLKHEWNQT